MNESPEPCQRRPHTEPDRHSIEFAQAATSADLLESAMWPYLPLCAARTVSMTLLLVMAVGVFAPFSRGAHAQSTEVLISNGEPPPSALRSAGGRWTSPADAPYSAPTQAALTREAEP